MKSALYIGLMFTLTLSACSLARSRDDMSTCRSLCGKAGATIYTNEYSPDTGAVKCGCRDGGQ